MGTIVLYCAGIICIWWWDDLIQSILWWCIHCYSLFFSCAWVFFVERLSSH